MRKEAVLSTIKQFNKLQRSNKEPKSNTNHLKVPGLNQAIYISEVLMMKNKKITHDIVWESIREVCEGGRWTVTDTY